MKRVQVNFNSVVIILLATLIVGVLAKMHSLETEVREDIQNQVDESVERELSAILDVYEIYIVE